VPGSPEHLRGYFFERFPRLLAIEIGRRPTDAAVRGVLQATGFSAIESVTLWEVRRTYDSREGLNRDLAGRTGRSILHELSDPEIEDLIAYIDERVSTVGQIVEKDRWTLWSAIA
jgi:hypothetical protein